MIIVVFGLPGSGKSYFAQRLAYLLSARYENSDRIRRELFALRDYSAAEKNAVYDEILRRMLEAANRNEHIVLDATFYQEHMRERFIQSASGSGREVIFMEIVAEEDIVKSRLMKPREYSEADYAVYLRLKAIFEPFQGKHLVLESTNDNIEQMLSKAMAYIDNIHEK